MPSLIFLTLAPKSWASTGSASSQAQTTANSRTLIISSVAGFRMRASRVTIRSEVVNEQEAADMPRGRAAPFLGPGIGRDARPGLPERAAAHRGAVSGGRFDGYRRARDGAEAPRPVQSAGGGRKPRGRERHDRCRARGEIASGRAHDAARSIRLRLQPDSVQESALRSGSRPRAGFEPRLRPHDSGRAPVAPGAIGAGAGSRRQVAPGRAQLWFGRLGLSVESLRGVVQFDGRRPDNPRSLQGDGRRARRRARGPGPRLLHEPASFPSLSEGREAARARSDQPPALADYPGAAHHRRSGTAGLRYDDLVRPVRSGGHAARRRLEAAAGSRADPEPAGHEGAD